MEMKCATCCKWQDKSEFSDPDDRKCNACRQWERKQHHLNSRPVNKQRKRASNAPDGLPPPYTAGTPAYFAWYRNVKRDCIKQGKPWQEFYQAAKAKALANVATAITTPPVREHKLPFKAGSPAYHAWYRQVKRDCIKAGELWPAYFEQAKQDLIKQHSSRQYVVPMASYASDATPVVDEPIDLDIDLEISLD